MKVKKVVTERRRMEEDSGARGVPGYSQGWDRTVFTGRYWNNHEPGLYRCICCGNALFRSNEKFESGTGWPSFWAPIAKENIRTETDSSLAFQTRTEVLCRKCDAHLGHVFEDGPPPTHLRYCMNSVSLRFIKHA